MAEFICNLSTYSYLQPIYFAEESTVLLVQRVSIDELVDCLFSAMEDKNIFNAHFFGDENFAKQFGDQLAIKIMARYKETDFYIYYN